MTFAATPELDDAMLTGIAGVLDASADPAYAVILDASATELVTIVFAKPAAELVDLELVFTQGDLTGDLIPTQGNATSFELYNGAGTLLGAGSVSDVEGSGDLKISGTTGTLLYAGARAILGELKFG